MARHRKSRGGKRGGMGIGKLVADVLIGASAGATGSAVTNNKFVGAGTGAATAVLEGKRDIKTIAVRTIAGYFGHDIAVMAQNTLAGTPMASGGSGPYG